VEDIFTQNVVVEQLKALFEQATPDDRRERPSHGYRAVHIIIPYSGKLIEVQVRTLLQHRWAEVSEKFSDVDPSIKYGVGDKDILLILADLSDRIMRQETIESELGQHIEKQVDPQQWFKLAFDTYEMKEDIPKCLTR
jgi:ppGpp synthetase/RelA/SpoT-type nucleotidyltranferase